VIYDFHTHTFNSDGELSPIELIHRAFINGYKAIAITDHIGVGPLKRVVKEIIDDCALSRKYWDIIAIPGVELTHLPPEAISLAAKEAKKLGAWLVVVHGESTAEPVPKGTNIAAIQSPDVDILAHPGLITLEEAKLAAINGVFLELSARRGHSKTNKHVATVSIEAKAKLIVNSDAHNEQDLLTRASVEDILCQAGLGRRLYHGILEDNPLVLLEKIKKLQK